RTRKRTQYDWSAMEGVLLIRDVIQSEGLEEQWSEGSRSDGVDLARRSPRTFGLAAAGSFAPRQPSHVLRSG
ncbi:MAG TPA: hypothetical protein VIU13_09060, partial [Chryseolinea sp.]